MEIKDLMPTVEEVYTEEFAGYSEYSEIFTEITRE